MEALHYHKTDLEIVTIDELDGELPALPQERNFLREKTFNNELNLLVNKIFNNEKMIEEPAEPDNDFNTFEKNSLLIQCEKLIYRLKHHEDLNAISSSYNPFDTDINVYDDIDDTVDYIKAGLLQCNYSKFQILKYNFNDKAYRSDINFLDTSYSADVYFSINDPLVSRIKEQTEGFIINSDLINSDPYFQKKFLNKDVNNVIPVSFFIVKISSLFIDSINIAAFKNKISKFEEFLSPLLLIELSSDVKMKSDEIFTSVKKTTALPLMIYFLKNRIKLSINNYSYEDTLLMIELFIKSSVNSKLKSYIITLNDYSVKENLFILKFALSKIRRILKKNSLILRISINRAVLITSLDVSDIYILIDNVNSGLKIIDMQSIDYNDYLNSKEFVNLFL